ncbi:MAG: N-acetyl sugar amidotransferase [Lentisphaeria bacterium]|nr:N-acetyl sugar amidotransferase [Lentisphaeria bacterium]
MNRTEYQICTRCIMDNAHDSDIRFQPNGTCNYCNNALGNIGKVYLPNAEGKARLDSMIAMLKQNGKGRKYDCMMGISGGLDSAYLAYLGAAKWGLRIFAVHIDDGFDTQLAQDNIRNLCKKAKIDLVYEKPDAEQFNELTRAFVLAGVPNIAMPQDNILFAHLYDYAIKNGLHYFLSGGNFALESILQTGNSHAAIDDVNIRDINRRFGRKPLNKLKLLSVFRKKVLIDHFYNISSLRPLNYMDYNKERALEELKAFSGFTYYAAKHCESIFTKFMQWYYLPEKFGVDKRKSHLSSLIVSGQMTREQALEELKKPLYLPEELEHDLDFICRKLDFSRAEFDEIMKKPGVQHSAYKTSKLLNLAIKIRKHL